jgi:hypothetical protein
MKLLSISNILSAFLKITFRGQGISSPYYEKIVHFFRIYFLYLPIVYCLFNHDVDTHIKK